MNRLSRRLMLLPLTLLALAIQSPGIRAQTPPDIDRFDVLLTANDNKIYVWNADSGLPEVAFVPSATQLAALAVVPAPEGGGHVQVLAADSGSGKGIHCCTTLGNNCNVIPGSESTSGTSGVAAIADGSVLFVDRAGPNMLKRLVRSANAPVCDFEVDPIDAIPGQFLQSVRGASGVNPTIANLGDALILTESALLRRTPSGQITDLGFNFGGKTPRDFVESTDGGFLFAMKENSIDHFAAGAKSSDASFATSGSPKRISLGFDEDPDNEGQLGAPQVCVSVVTGSIDAECHALVSGKPAGPAQVVVSGTSTTDGIYAGAGGGAIASIEAGQQEVSLLATKVVFESTEGGSASCFYTSFPHPGGADALSSDTVPGFLASDVPGLSNIMASNFSFADNIVPIGAYEGGVVNADAKFVLWWCEHDVEVKGSVKTFVSESEFDVDASLHDCHDPVITGRPRLVCRGTLSNGEDPAPAPETFRCAEETAFCNSPVAGVGWRPWSFHMLGARKEHPDVTAQERLEGMLSRIPDLPGLARGERNSLRMPVRAALNHLRGGRYDKVREAVQDARDAACALSLEARGEAMARLSVIDFHTSQPEQGCPAEGCPLPAFGDPLCP